MMYYLFLRNTIAYIIFFISCFSLYSVKREGIGLANSSIYGFFSLANTVATGGREYLY